MNFKAILKRNFFKELLKKYFALKIFSLKIAFKNFKTIVYQSDYEGKLCKLEGKQDDENVNSDFK